MKAAVIIAIGTGFVWFVFALLMTVRAVSMLHAFLIIGAQDSPGGSKASLGRQ